jgi:hypothetical protein
VTSSMTTIKALVALLLLMANTTPSGQPTQKQPADYTPARQSKVVSWQLQRVPPPSPVYVGVDDLLVVGAASSQTNEVVTVNYRLLRAADGVIVPGQLTVAPANTRAVKVQTQQLAEGFLLSVSVKAAVATTRGMTFVRAFLGAGPFGAGQPSYMLMADYVTTAMAPAHPNGRVLAPTEGPGWVHPFQVTNPAAGADWNFIVPTNARLRLQTFSAIFSTSPTAATRTPILDIGSGGTPFAFRMPSNFGHVASTIATYSGGAAAALPVQPANAGVITVPVPTGIILSGITTDAVSTATTNIQAADQWSQIVLGIEEWLDNV